MSLGPSSGQRWEVELADDKLVHTTSGPSLGADDELNGDVTTCPYTLREGCPKRKS